MDDQKYMKMALELAQKGRGFTSPNPMVGAVIVKDGAVISTGYHRKAGEDHAEADAIKQAGEGAKGATLYVNLEPCNHVGRTPPCSQRILAAGIKRVVSAMKDPNPGVKGGGNRHLKDHGVDVVCGVCEDQARRLNEIFIKNSVTGLPFVIVKCAATLDGRIASSNGDSRWVTGEESREYVHGLRHLTDAIMVGVGTAIQDDPSLTTRLQGMKGRDPLRVILDSKLSIPEHARVFHLDSDAKTLVAAGTGVSPEKKSAIEKTGAQVVECPMANGGIDLGRLVERLGKMGITSLLIEGGSRVIASAFSAGIVDKIMFFYAPKIMGGDGIPMCQGPGPDAMKGCLAVKHIAVRMFGDDLMVEGYPVKGSTEK